MAKCSTAEVCRQLNVIFHRIYDYIASNKNSHLINIEKYEKKLNTKIETFVGSFMSNSKWRKLFIELSLNHEKIEKCFIKDVLDNTLREIQIPPIENYDDSYSETGIKDGVMTGGPCEFKTIEQIIFPHEWDSDRKMRGQKLESKKCVQNIQNIKIKIDQLGKFEIEIDNDSLIIYAYK